MEKPSRIYINMRVCCMNAHKIMRVVVFLDAEWPNKVKKKYV